MKEIIQTYLIGVTVAIILIGVGIYIDKQYYPHLYAPTEVIE
ncbi:hypothetical protein [Synechococcus phage MA10]